MQKLGISISLMEASVSPLYITGKCRLHCHDQTALEHHLTEVLKYNAEQASRIKQEISTLLSDNDDTSVHDHHFWVFAAENISAEAIRAILLVLEHSELLHLLSYRNMFGDTALHWCARFQRSDIMKLILECLNEDEWSQLFSTAGFWGRIPLHLSCDRDDTESVELMLDNLRLDKQSLLLETAHMSGDSPLHEAAARGYTDTMMVIRQSVTEDHWLDLLQKKGYGGFTVLQGAAYLDKQGSITAIKDSVSDADWMKLLAIPLPEYNTSVHFHKGKYQEAGCRIDEMRKAARVKNAIGMANKTGINFVGYQCTGGS